VLLRAAFERVASASVREATKSQATQPRRAASVVSLRQACGRKKISAAHGCGDLGTASRDDVTRAGRADCGGARRWFPASDNFAAGRPRAALHLLGVVRQGQQIGRRD